MAHSNVIPVALTGVDAQKIFTGAPGAATAPAGGAPGLYYGFTIRETAGAVAVVVLRDKDVAGTILEEIGLDANEDDRAFYGPQGIKVGSGTIYVQVVSGAVAGSVRVG